MIFHVAPALLSVSFLLLLCCTPSHGTRVWRLSPLARISTHGLGYFHHHQKTSFLTSSRISSTSVRVGRSYNDIHARGRDSTQNLTIWITSNFGMSSFLRRSQKFEVGRDTTVLDLKELIQDNFPGNPPVDLQKLFVDSTLLRDDQIWGNLTNKMLLPAQLDLISGTMIYNRTSHLSIAKSIDAYISLCVHEAYLTNTLTDVLTSATTDRTMSSTFEPDSVKYRKLYKQLNESFYAELGPEITAALAAEGDPSFDSTSPAVTTTTTPITGTATPINEFFKRELVLTDEQSSKLNFWSMALLVRPLSQHTHTQAHYSI